VADPGSTFVGWSGAGCSGTADCTVDMTAARSVTATFDLLPVTHTLEMTLAGDGGGTVTSDPAGIDCGSDCSEDYAAGTLVTLSADPDEGSTFTGWSGDCTGTASCVLTMDAARSVTATFTAESPSADISVSQTDTPDPVTAGNLVNYALTIANHGPDAASGVILTDTLPNGTTLVTVVGAECDTAGQVLTCVLGTIPAEGTVEVSIVVAAPTVTSPTTVTNTASVAATEDDPVPANNESVEQTLVEPPPDDPDTASGWVTAAGGTVATNAGKPPTKQDPMTTSVTVPPGFPGVVSITEGPITTCDAEYVCFGQEAMITAPMTTASTPLRLVFSYHPGSLPPSTQLSEIVMFHDDVLVERCTGPTGIASPDPCIASVARVKGSVQVVVLSSENGSWRGGR
jgi:uncharacterized repeat protein (TIGR01451 family)